MPGRAPNPGRYVVELLGGVLRQKWVPPAADTDYNDARTSELGIAAARSLRTPGVPGLSYGRTFGPVVTPWLWVVPQPYLYGGYGTQNFRVIPRGLPAQTGEGPGTPRAGPGPGTDLFEIAPGQAI